MVEDARVIERLKDDEYGGVEGESVKIIEYSSRRVVIEADIKSAGLIILSDTFYPGWRVSVNNETSEALRVDGILRGVLASTGKNVIVWEYRPRSFICGVIIFLASLVVCAFFFVRSRSRGSLTNGERLG